MLFSEKMKKIFNYYNIIIISFLCSCASYDYNQVKTSKHTIKTGRKGLTVWNDKLVFHRISWYQGATLLSEVNYALVPSDSPFINWFDSGELSSTSKCKQILAVIDYSDDSRRVNKKDFTNLLEKNGFINISTPTFFKELINHPDMMALSNKNYSQKLYCQPSGVVESLSIYRPGFENKVINIVQ